jgi:hypothetical protein
VTDSALQFTKRELQRIFFASRFWAVLLAAALLLGIVGPFATFESLALLPRIAYWMGITVATWFTGYATVLLVEGLIAPDDEPSFLVAAAAGAFAGIPVAAIVGLINSQVFPNNGFEFLPLVLYCAAISSVVSGLFSVVVVPLRRAAETPASGAAGPMPEGESGAAAAARPPLLDRLPANLRGKLLYLSMQDHYVEVHTEKGRMLLLMRFADAIRETGNAAGMRIHRSHWVAFDAVSGNTRRRGRLFLKLADGAVLPVSRSYLDAVRAAGWG